MDMPSRSTLYVLMVRPVMCCDVLCCAQTTSAAPHGMIDLVDCVSVKADMGSKKPSALEVVTRDETIAMHAATDHEREGWLGAIGK